MALPLLACCNAALAQSAFTSTSAFAGELYGVGNRQNSSDSANVPGPSSSHAAAASWDDHATELIDNLVVDFKQHSASSASASVDAGELHLLAEASSTVTPSQFEYIDDQGNAVDVATPLVAVAYSNANAGMFDTITITSSTLAAGSPVEFRVTTTLHSSITSPPYGNAQATADLLFYKPNLGYTDDNGSSYFGYIVRSYNGTELSQDVEQTSDILHTFVGDSFTVELDAGVSATGDADANRPVGYALADAGNTAYFNLDPVTTGATYITDSGRSYLTSAPEPASLAFLGALALPIFRRRR